MATKQELEQQVADLTKKLEEKKATTQIAQERPEELGTGAVLEELRAENDSLRTQLEALQEDFSTISAELASRVPTPAPAPPTLFSEYTRMAVELDGSVFYVSHRGRAKDIFEDVYKKRYCLEDSTVLVLERTGS